MLVTKTNFCILVRSSEIGILEIMVIHYSFFHLNQALKEITKSFSDLIAWAYNLVDDSFELDIPEFTSKELKNLMKKITNVVSFL